MSFFAAAGPQGPPGEVTSAQLASVTAGLKGGAVSTHLVKKSGADYDYGWVSAAAGGGGSGSVTSANFVSLVSDVGRISEAVSVLSQAVSVLSQAVSALSQSVSVLSNAVSVISAGLGGLQIRVVGGIQGISATALANISGLSASVASAAVYQLDGQVLYRMSVADIIGFGITFPAGTVAAGHLAGNTSVGQGDLSVLYVIGTFDEAASGSIILSLNPTGTSTRIVRFEGLFQVSTTAGTIQMQARTSATTSPINIQKGSYLRAYKVG